jgi:hypothetical protein
MEDEEEQNMATAIPPPTHRAEYTKTVCLKCKGLTTDIEGFLFTSKWPYPRYRHHDSYLLLSSSARNGCGICQVISEVLLEDAISRGKVVDLFTCEGHVDISGLGDHDPNKTDLLLEVKQSGECNKITPHGLLTSLIIDR